jgi:uncharacterized protein YcbX
MDCEITAIYTYPVKSCHGNALADAHIPSAGIFGDRQLMMLRNGEIVNQIQIPALAKVAPVRLGENEIELHANGHGTFLHQVISTGETTETDLYGNTLGVVRQGQAPWYSPPFSSPLYCGFTVADYPA